VSSARLSLPSRPTPSTARSCQPSARSLVEVELGAEPRRAISVVALRGPRSGDPRDDRPANRELAFGRKRLGGDHGHGLRSAARTFSPCSPDAREPARHASARASRMNVSQRGISAHSGDLVEEGISARSPHFGSSRRIACRQKPSRYTRKTPEKSGRARTKGNPMDDHGGRCSDPPAHGRPYTEHGRCIHILQLNSRELCKSWPTNWHFLYVRGLTAG